MTPDEIPVRPTCPGCKREIDPDVCWCGDMASVYHDNHYPVPMGCVCLFAEGENPHA